MSEIRNDRARSDAKRQEKTRQDKAQDTKTRTETRQRFQSAMKSSNTSKQASEGQKAAQQQQSQQGQKTQKQQGKQVQRQPLKQAKKDEARSVLDVARQQGGQKGAQARGLANAHRAASATASERRGESEMGQSQLEGRAGQSQERQKVSSETRRQGVDRGSKQSQVQEGTQRSERGRETQDGRQTQSRGLRAQRSVAGATAAAIEGVGGMTGRTEGKPGTAGGPRIPQALIEALARKIFVGLGKNGDAQFEIELGGSMLAGVRLRIQAKDGKVSISIGGDNEEGGRMLAAHHTELAAVFRHKNLDLDELSLDET